MDDFNHRAADALALLPEDMQEAAIGYLFEQAEKLQSLKVSLHEGFDDAKAGSIKAWDMEDFMRRARPGSSTIE